MFLPETTHMFLDAIRELAAEGADCTILGCTEIPLIIHSANSPLPVFDSTRLLAAHAVSVAASEQPLQSAGGWVTVDAAIPAVAGA
jgi:aspartate racemase